MCSLNGIGHGKFTCPAATSLCPFFFNASMSMTSSSDMLTSKPWVARKHNVYLTYMVLLNQ